jgi:SNF family Na+-dependent transporter
MAGDDEGRTRWQGRASFILACVGSAVGLGNVWRFPNLVYKFGGGTFFIPYLMALIFIGIPLLILEFGLGQAYQSGDIIAFGTIHKRLRGVGFASVFEAFMVVVYYNAIIAWSLRYFGGCFQYPLPWMPGPKPDPSTVHTHIHTPHIHTLMHTHIHM